MDTRTGLVKKNAHVIQEIAAAIVPKNPDAFYVIVTNPVDAMATLFKRISGAKWVISTGTNLDSQRFRSELTKWLTVPLAQVSGFVGGEHGNAAVFLWSSVRINGLPLDEYLTGEDKSLDRTRLEESVKAVSRLIIRATGGTRLGPAASFRDIVRSIALDENRVLAIAAPYEAPGVPEPVMVGLPQMVGKSLGPTLESSLMREERVSLGQAAAKIYETYCQAIEALG
jgi:malate dehydrogenase